MTTPLKFLLLLALIPACNKPAKKSPGRSTPPAGENPANPPVQGAPGEDSTGTPGATAPLAGLLPCDVEPVVQQRCHLCHGQDTRAGAGIALLGAADWRRPAPSDSSRTLAVMAGLRIRDNQRPMPPAPHPRLNSAELNILSTWVQAGAPDRTRICSTGSSGGSAPVPGGTPGTGSGGSTVPGATQPAPGGSTPTQPPPAPNSRCSEEDGGWNSWFLNCEEQD